MTPRSLLKNVREMTPDEARTYALVLAAISIITGLVRSRLHPKGLTWLGAAAIVTYAASEAGGVWLMRGLDRMRRRWEAHSPDEQRALIQNWLDDVRRKAAEAEERSRQATEPGG